MIDDLDRTIEAMLMHDLPPTMAKQVAVSFASPDGEFPPASVALPAIDLFLYDIRENRDLRSNEWFVDRAANGVATKCPPQARMDCSYLITAWANAAAPNPAQDEHRLIGEVIRVLLRYATIPATLLQGSLKGQAPPLPTSTLSPSLLPGWGDFWQAIGGKPKVALNYTVTIGLDVMPPFEAGAPVRDKQLRSVPVGVEE